MGAHDQRVGNEAENGLAIAEAERLGRPLPSGLAPRPAIGSEEWKREIAEI
jgi:hypothetical protein